MSESEPRIPSYKNPPIIEAVWSIQFSELSWLLPPHVGLFWNRIRESYPTCQEHPLIAHMLEAEGIFTASAPRPEVVPTPPLSRQWFVSPSENELIQFQRDRLCCNWRKIGPDDQYARYEYMRKFFQSSWSSFCEFVAEMRQPPPAVDQCEMTYINHIGQGQGWENVGDIERVFPSLRWDANGSYLKSPRTLGAKMSFDIPSLRGRLHVTLRHAMKQYQDSQDNEVFLLDLTARGLPEQHDIQGLLKWYSAARDAIVKGFTDLTGTEMHEIWERER